MRPRPLVFTPEGTGLATRHDVGEIPNRKSSQSAARRRPMTTSVPGPGSLEVHCVPISLSGSSPIPRHCPLVELSDNNSLSIELESGVDEVSQGSRKDRGRRS